MPNSDRPDRSTRALARRADGVTIDAWTHRADYFHLDALDLPMPTVKLLGKKMDWDAWEIDGTAEVASDPDRAKVGVFVQGHLVGYLSDADAEPYLLPFRELTAAKVHLLVPIRGQWSRHDYFDSPPTDYASLTIRLPPPGGLVPFNRRPDGRQLMLPPGAAMKVTGCQEHLASLRHFLTTKAECYVYTTLHTVVMQRARSTVTLIEVRIDGQAVGQLSKVMSDQMRPLIDELARSGIATVCRTAVLGNVLAAAVVLYAARPTQLSNAWLSEALKGAH